MRALDDSTVPRMSGGNDLAAKGPASVRRTTARVDRTNREREPALRPDTGRCRFGTEGSHIGTGCSSGCLRMVEVVAGGSLCSGIVEPRPGCDEMCGFQFLQRSHEEYFAQHRIRP